MDNMAIVSIMFPGLIAQIVMLVVVRFAFIRRLKRVDPERWQMIREPCSAPLGSSFGSVYRLVRYLACREYLLSKDRKLARRAALYSICLGTYIIYFLVMAVLFLATAW
jgi:hypothetical protein